MPVWSGDPPAAHGCGSPDRANPTEGAKRSRCDVQAGERGADHGLDARERSLPERIGLLYRETSTDAYGVEVLIVSERDPPWIQEVGGGSSSSVVVASRPNLIRPVMWPHGALRLPERRVGCR